MRGRGRKHQRRHQQHLTNNHETQAEAMGQIETTKKTLRVTLPDLMEHWQIPTTGRPIILIGDGSGSGYDKPIGFGCVLIDYATGKRKQFGGGLSSGTVAHAEIIPYVQALTWYIECRRREGSMTPFVAWIISDSNFVVTLGQQLVHGEKSLSQVADTRPWWAALLSVQHDDVDLQFKWEKRATTLLNCYVDKVSKIHFNLMKSAPEPTVNGRVFSPYEANPGPRKSARPRGLVSPPARD